MPANSSDPTVVQLLERPNLRHLKDQAKDLVKAGACDLLTDAQSIIARRYGFGSWPKLKVYVESVVGGEMGELERAIQDEDIPKLLALLREDPDLIHREGHWVKRKHHNGYLPLAYAAFCGKVRVMASLIAAGADVHHGGDKALRAATYGSLDAMEILIEHGADPHATTRNPSGRPEQVIDYPCMLLAPERLRLLLANGAELTPSSIGAVVASNERNPTGKAGCLDAIEEAGFQLPDTEPTAVHRRQTDRLGERLQRDPRLFSRVFSEADIFPAEFEIQHPSAYAYVTPLIGGVTLLHMAVEFCDLELAQWMIQNGADVNVRSAVDEEGYGGWTPLFHAMATLHHPRSFGELASLLLEHGAEPNAKASIRKPDAEGQWLTWDNVTAAEYAQSFVYPDLVNQEALELVSDAVRTSCLQ